MTLVPLYLMTTHVPKVSIQHFHVTVHDLKRDQLIVGIGDGADEKQGRIASVDDLGVCAEDDSISFFINHGCQLATDLCTLGSCTSLFVLLRLVE